MVPGGHPDSHWGLAHRAAATKTGTDEPFRAFTARVRGKAETCEFMAEYECGKGVNYTDHAIWDVLLNGIYDPNIRREVLGTQDILKTPISDVIALVENKEIA